MDIGSMNINCMGLGLRSRNIYPMDIYPRVGI